MKMLNKKRNATVFKNYSTGPLFTGRKRKRLTIATVKYHLTNNIYTTLHQPQNRTNKVI